MTARQAQVLEAIVELAEELGWPPTVREIGEHVGLRSPSTVQSHLDALDRDGMIVRGHRSSRALRLSARGWDALAGDSRAA